MQQTNQTNQTKQARDWYRPDLVAEGLARSGKPRESLFLTTKVHPRDLGAARTRAAFERAVKALRTDYADLLLLHYPRCSEVAGCSAADMARPNATWRESWRELERLHREGRARAIGARLQDTKRAGRGPILPSSFPPSFGVCPFHSPKRTNRQAPTANPPSSLYHMHRRLQL